MNTQKLLFASKMTSTEKTTAMHNAAAIQRSAWKIHNCMQSMTKTGCYQSIPELINWNPIQIQLTVFRMVEADCAVRTPCVYKCVYDYDELRFVMLLCCVYEAYSSEE